MTVLSAAATEPDRNLSPVNLTARSRSIDEARGHVAIVRSGEYAAMRSLFEDLFNRQKAIITKMGPDALLARLRQEVDEVGGRANGRAGG